MLTYLLSSNFFKTDKSLLRLLRSGPGMLEGLSRFNPGGQSSGHDDQPIYDKTQLPASLQERLSSQERGAYNDYDRDWGGGRRDPSSYSDRQQSGEFI